jgi:transketolase
MADVISSSSCTSMTGLQLDSPQALQQLANRLRLDIIEMIFQAQSGHPGTSLSCIDVLTTLWFAHMRHRANQPDWADRDRCVLSKGHGAPALYAVLMEAGYIAKDQLTTLRRIHSHLQGHPASKHVLGVDVSTGSLGQGLSCAVGMALGLRLNQSPARVYAVLGDGECQEGNTWEAIMSAAHHQVSRLTAIVDRNGLQIDGDTEAIKALGDLGEKFAAFGWRVLRVDGHDFAALLAALKTTDAHMGDGFVGQPTAIIAKSIKGKGVSFMENQAGWHGKAPNKEQYEAAMAELRLVC